MTKEEWDSLRYPLTLRQLSEEEGGGWHAEIPMLGEGAFVGDGETPAEAVEDLEERRRRSYDLVIKSGRTIPIPTDITDEYRIPSGKWLMRTSPRLHAELKSAAEHDGLSFNAYCNRCLERGHAILSLRDVIDQAVRELCTKLSKSNGNREEPTAPGVSREAGSDPEAVSSLRSPGRAISLED